jgi:hypothetical protein
MDVLAPEGYGEIIGGGQREDCWRTSRRASRTTTSLARPSSWYLDLRRYGSVPHAGFGLGLERTVAWTCGLSAREGDDPLPADAQPPFAVSPGGGVLSPSTVASQATGSYKSPWCPTQGMSTTRAPSRMALSRLTSTSRPATMVVTAV